jgi:hypothetical protein
MQKRVRYEFWPLPSFDDIRSMHQSIEHEMQSEESEVLVMLCSGGLDVTQ